MKSLFGFCANPMRKQAMPAAIRLPSIVEWLNGRENVVALDRVGVLFSQ